MRAYAAFTTETIEEARRRHDMLAVAFVVMGRSMTAGVILGAMLKGEEKLTIKMNGGGPFAPCWLMQMPRVKWEDMFQIPMRMHG
ncbi:Hsp33 family molecular chaperone HslO [Peribacillus frigoritolerans]|uniref:Hsp33 family molecular chaperone HslO n=1 Tax=Peribacillus frigoritolerans TaxID=450367 RepID=UPI003D6D0F36